ncbi:MAG: hypothetical protein IJW58_03080 [Clostridia bacterium]|nr:hypothetical protein [Clostridia bacterium]
MEPFALFNLLQSFLPKAEISSPQPQNSPEPTPTEQPDNSDVPQANPTQNGEPFDSPSQNFCLDFIRRHEERAGRKR